MQKTENYKIANIIGLRPQKFAKLMYVVEKDAAEKMRRFSAKSKLSIKGLSALSENHFICNFSALS